MKITTFNISLKTPTVLTTSLVNKAVGDLWNTILVPNIKDDNDHVLLLLKVKFTNGKYRTLSNMLAVGIMDQKVLSQHYIARLGVLADNDHSDSIDELNFLVIPLKANPARALLQTEEYKATTYNFNNINLPLSMNPNDYGKVLAHNPVADQDGYATTTIVINGTKIFQIFTSKDQSVNKVEYTTAQLKWLDTKIGDNMFKREIGQSTIYVQNGEIIAKEKVLPAKPFKKVIADKALADLNTFMTMDIETIKFATEDPNKKDIVPYLIAGNTYNEHIEVFTEDIEAEESQQLMIFKFIDLVLKFKDIKYVYSHNLGGFDGIFMLKHLYFYPGAKVDPIIFHGRLMGINFSVKEDGKTRKIVFKDSLLLLPSSLRRLCKAFGLSDLEVKKWYPFGIGDFNYVGDLPARCYYPGNMPQEEYIKLELEFKGKVWNFKKQASIYCKQDCVVLFAIIKSFNEIIFNLFSLNIHSSYTLPALAMRIFKTHYLKENQIYQILGFPEKDIRQAYTGGAVDVYKPHNLNVRVTYGYIGSVSSGYTTAKNKIYHYDVNSLYPYVLKNFNMPVGKPHAFTGDIRRVDPNAFGFFYCKITTPDNIDHPILQRRIQTKDGVRTIACIGSWQGWVASIEMDKCIEIGYKFEILKGYKFKAAKIFEGYVTKMYEIRQKYPKDNPLNLIAKLLLNSLYGKFGMSSSSEKVSFIDRSTKAGFKEANLLFKLAVENNKIITDAIRLDEDKFIVFRKNVDNYFYNENTDTYEGLDVNVAIAANVTAGGRVVMSNFKNQDYYNLYYSDNDSIFIDKRLPKELVGDKLGQFKLEDVIDYAVFIAPKVYAYVTTEHKQIIKVKGLSSTVKTVELDEFHKLLILLGKGSYSKFEKKNFIKDFWEGKITKTQLGYHLRTTSNKRELIFEPSDDNSISIFSGTKPYRYEDLIQSSQD